jgi:hypothetical protein
MILVRAEIKPCVWKSLSACRNHTQVCRNPTHACRNHTRACENHTLRAEITLARVEITLGRVFWKIECVLAKIYLKIDTHACEFHTQTCYFLLLYFLTTLQHNICSKIVRNEIFFILIRFRKIRLKSSKHIANTYFKKIFKSKSCSGLLVEQSK